MKIITSTQEKDLLLRLQQNDETAFRIFFDAYYKYLTSIAYRYLREKEKSKDIAQEAFVELWNRRSTLNISTGLKSYLGKTVVNKCLNHIKREKRIDFSEPTSLPETPVSPDAIHHLEKEDLQQTIHQAVDSLPKKCKIIFCMSRFEEKSHKEIAAELNISTKTIENQITIALKILRKAIKKTTLLFFLILSIL